MAIVIEEMDATVMPGPANAPSSPQSEPSRPPAGEAEPFVSSLRYWKRREMRLRAD